jgi:hypothetical protein
VTGLQFAAAVLSALAWPTAVVVAVGLLRPELAGAFHRMQSLEFPGGKATFATLLQYEVSALEALAEVAHNLAARDRASDRGHISAPRRSRR